MTCDTWNPESDTPTSNLSAQVGKSKAHDRCEHHTTTIEEAEAMSNAIHAAKKQLRLLVRQRLAGLDQANLHAQSVAVTKKILNDPIYQRAKRISIYISLPTSELRTDAIIQDALSQNKKVFVPYIPPHKDSKMEMLHLKDEEEFASLIPNKWKIREFPHAAEPSTIFSERENGLNVTTNQGLDLILMPGLAFDRHLNRLGHGRGYYDTYLHRCALFSQQHNIERPKTIALALNEQILDEGQTIPAFTVEDGHSSGHRDIKPDCILYPDGELVLDVVEGSSS
ncbi:hypothetical protein P389DRAFT_165071 [Cystobasidium minutum MCA 4210]|uniref:uncharacterized protein n=1 Tax=Cystobasidium minutum MCA 4210 TaxID=1397322 RepID=UPI0034CD748C|eukprot:jgi/Rhomi1/165071/fgenesh1_kg.1_\